MKKMALVFLEEGKLSPRGGPYGVGYYIHREVLETKCDSIDFLPDRIIDNKKNLMADIKKFASMFICPNKKPPVDFEQYNAVHFHTARDLYLSRKMLNGYDGTVLLTSHSPEPPAIETMHRIGNRVPSFLYSFLYRWFERADRYAFTRADYIIFPCEEAEEPYIKHWKYFGDYKAKNPEKFKYVLTGIADCKPSRLPEEIRAEQGIDNDRFIISFVGRHNVVKGYEDLKKIGLALFNIEDKSVIMVAGKQESISPLDNQRWIEIGYTTDAYSYINASDIFVLPNKETYFDLVMLEVLSLGKPVVASRTGGNRYFEKIGAKGVFLYDTIEEAKEIIMSLEKMSQDDLQKIGQNNKEIFEERFTSREMFESYKALLLKIEAEKK